MERFVFELGGEAFSLETRYVYRIMDEVRVTPVPLMPPCYMGLTYYRGDLFDVIHLGGLLKEEAASWGGESRLILIKWAGHNLGLVVDRVIGLSSVEDPDHKGAPVAPKNGGPRLITLQDLWDRLMGFRYGP